MDEFQLPEALQRCFNNYFLCLDDEKSGKVHINKVVDLIKSGNVPDDILSQVNLACILDFPAQTD